MPKKRKKFDCVEMKNEIQRKILAEYEARKGEFASFADFVNARVKASPWCRKMMKRFSHPKSPARSARRTVRQRVSR